MTQKNEAQAKAPNFYRWFEGFLNRMAASGDQRKVRMTAAVRKAQQEMHAWFEQAAIDRAASKIGGDQDVNEQLLSGGLTRRLASFRQSVTDDIAGIGLMERGMTGTISPVGATEIARLIACRSLDHRGSIDARPARRKSRWLAFVRRRGPATDT